VEAVRASKQRDARLVIANFRLEPSPILVGNVWRVAGDEIERTRKASQQVRAAKLDSVGHAVSGRISSRHVEGGRRDVGGVI
jgi:hypothetical protein